MHGAELSTCVEHLRSCRQFMVRHLVRHLVHVVTDGERAVLRVTSLGLALAACDCMTVCT